jgi:hypothetical protein
MVYQQTLVMSFAPKSAHPPAIQTTLVPPAIARQAAYALYHALYQEAPYQTSLG